MSLDRYAVLSILGALRRDKQVFTNWAPKEDGKKRSPKTDELDRKCAEIFVRDDAVLYGIFQAFDDKRVESITITPNYRRTDDGEEA